MKDYTIEVHFLAYEVMTLQAENEMEAHEKARRAVNAFHDNIIRVVQAGTTFLDGREIDDISHVTEF